MPDNSIGHLSAPITQTRPSDVVMSPDGDKVYVADLDGNVSVYDMATRALLATWDVGISLGGMDISPDGSYLVVTERSIVGARSEGEYGPYYSTQVVYRVDTSGGQVDTHSIEIKGGYYSFHDAAILSGGVVFLTENAYSGYYPYMRLNLATGEFDVSSATFSTRATLATTYDHSLGLFAPGDSSLGAIYSLSSGGALTQQNGHPGTNTGVLAISNTANMIAQYTHGGGASVYDLNLNFIANISALHTEISTNLAALTFSVSGEHLYVLRGDTNTIYQLATSDWHIIRSFDVGASVGTPGWGDYGNELLVSDDERQFTVVTSTGLRLVENDSLANDFVGSSGNDDLSAGLGDDRVSGQAGNDLLRGDAGNDELHGGDGADSLIGGTGDDALFGDAGDDSLDGDIGYDEVSGGAGSDTLVISWADSLSGVSNSVPFVAGLDGYAGAFGNGSDRSVVFTGIEAMQITTGSGADSITTGENRDTVILGGGADFASTGGGDDYIDGGLGADSMTGGVGNDIYVVDEAGDNIVELAGEGTDEVRTALSSYGLGDNLESLTGTSALGQTLTGNAADNILTGGSGNDTLNGGSGADSMSGGFGNDVYFVDNNGDQVTEASNRGTDSIYASLSYVLPLGLSIERLFAAAGTDPLALTGNTFAQTIVGNAGANLLTGGGGSDYLVGLGGDDVLVGSPNAFSSLQGGTGDDWYYVNRGDSVIEAAGEGNDRIVTASNYTLSAGQEIETLTTSNQAGTAAISLTGNALAQVIFGNSGANNLTGGGGADYLLGLGGNDILFGNSDAASTLQGGAGDDWYYILRTGDSLVEFAGEGNDRILTSVSYALSAGQEVETLAASDQQGTGAIDLIGNDFAQVVLGNNGANILAGGGAADDLSGLGGNDILLGDDGADTLNGGLGADVLNGGGGADLFVFANALGAGNVDTVQDHATGQDRFLLEDSVFAGLGTGVLAAGAFVTGSAAHDADDRILYDPTTGALYFDADGTGAAAAIQFATLIPGTSLVASDFVVI
jgi:Ca2+-binding RTX toxin-like protein